MNSEGEPATEECHHFGVEFNCNVTEIGLKGAKLAVFYVQISQN